MKKIYKVLAFTLSMILIAIISQAQINTLLTESFDGGNGTTPPTGWAIEQVSGTAGQISFVTAGSLPTCSPYDGTRLVQFNSYSAASGNSTRLKKTVAFSTIGNANITVDFRWYEDPGYASYQDKVEIQWSTNGASWNTAGTFLRYNATTGWKYKTQILPVGTAGQSTLYIAFLFTSAYGYNCHLDIVHVTGQQNPSNTWTQKANFNGTARNNSVGFSISNKAYVGTGSDGSFKKDFWEFDPLLNSWTQKADFGGTARHMAIGFAIGSKGYIGTGYDGSSKKDFWEFDPTINIWTQKADFGGTARYNSVGFSIGTKGYVGTGYDGGNKKDFWEFDPILNTWTQKADFGGTARDLAIGFSIGIKGYIGTGYDGSYKKDFWEFDPSLNTWTQKTDFGGTGRYGAVGFSIGAKGFIGTGMEASYKKDFWEFDPLVNLWTQRTDLSGTARYNAVGFSVGTKGYIGTGNDGSNKNDFWEYTPDGFRVGLLPGKAFCASSSVSVPFNSSTTYNPGNVFTAQLSDSLGNFSTPVNIGTLTGTGFGTISATIPSGTLSGWKFRIRVTSSNPAALSIDNLIDLSVFQSVPGSAGPISGLTNICNQSSSNYSISVIPYATSYTWSIPTGYTSNGSVSNSIIVTSGSNPSSGNITVTGHNNCGDGISSSLPITSFNCGNIWTQKTDLGTSRSGAVGFSIGTKGYIGTGNDGGYKHDIWEFNPLTNAWTQKADFAGSDRNYAVGFSIGTKGYIGTGDGTEFKKDIWEFDPLLNSWTQKADFGGTARRLAVGFSINNKGYIGTGNDGSDRKDFWEFDPLLNTWTQKADFGGTARSGATGLSIGNKGYIGLGSAIIKDFWEYDPLLNSWTQKADFGGVARYWACGFSIGVKGYIGSGDGDGGTRKDFWEFDPLSNIWTRKADFGGTGRSSAVGFSIGVNGYLGTGYANGATRDFWEYTPDGFRVGSISGAPFCAGSVVNIPFTISTPCNSGNVFTAQLSDSLGNFNNPVSIGTFTGVISGTITSTLPAETPSGLKYRIRVISSDPPGISSDNLIDLMISHSLPGSAGIISGSDELCTKSLANYSIAAMPDAVSYVWTIPSGFTGNNSVTNNIVVNSGSNPASGNLTVSGHNGCGDGPSATLPIASYRCGENWIQRLDFGGFARYHGVGFSIGDKGYIGSGYTDAFGYCKDFWEFDPGLNVWTQKADFSGSKREGAVGFSIGTKGYFGTGSGEDGSPMKDFWEFDPVLNSWTQKADFGGTRRYNAAGFSINSKGYIGTGYDGSDLTKDFWEFDPSMNIWTQKADFGGTARHMAIGFSISNKGYIGTGNDGYYSQDFWEFDPLVNTWSQKTDFGGTARYGVVGFSIGSKGYIGTGIDVTTRKDFWEFNPQLNTWTQKENYSGPACLFSVGFSIGNKGYVGTGYENFGSSSKDFWEYTPDGFKVGLLADNSFCAGSTVDIPFTISLLYNPGNLFTAQLSDSAGSFSNPVSIGSITGVGPDTIVGVIPSGTQNGVRYRIRVVSSDPIEISADNLVDLSINNSVPGTPGSISGPLPGCLLNTSIYSVPPLTNALYYNWTIPSGTTSNASKGNSIPVKYESSFTVGSLSVKGHNGCGDGNSITLPLSMMNCGNNWLQKADFIGTARAGAVGFSVGTKGYIGTGYDLTITKVFWEFDPVLNSWSQKADFGGTARNYAVGFSIGNKGYIGTGLNYDGNQKDFWEYDPVLNIWTQRADFGGTARYAAVGFSIGAKGYIGTGDDGINKVDFWEFDPLLNNWIQKADFGGTARSYAVGFSIGSKGYIGTGDDGTFKKDFWEFDPVLNNWTPKADFNGVGRRWAVGFSINTKGYIGTGNDGMNSKNDLWEYDPLSNTWTIKADFRGTPRLSAVGFSTGNKGYLGTGDDGIYTKDFWEYTPDGFRTGLLKTDNYCAGSIVSVPFTLSIPCYAGNIFTAQLSDSSGSFANPIDIGNLNGMYSDTISGTLPLLATNGYKYRIRVQSSNPLNASIDNLYNLSIYSATIPGIVSGGTTISLGSLTDTLMLTGNSGSI